MCVCECMCMSMCEWMCVHECVCERESHVTKQHSLVFGVAAGMNNSIHVEVEIIKLHVVRVRLSRIHWYFHPIYLLSLYEMEH